MTTQEKDVADDDAFHDAFASAEEVIDPLEGLAEKAAVDPGLPFQPEVLRQLTALRKSNRAAFEALRAQLKKTDCRVTALDEAIAEESGETGGRGPTQADILINLAEAAQTFHTLDGTAYADIEVNGHRETWSIRAKGFRRWLTQRYFHATQGAPSSEALQSALNVIEAKAHFEAAEKEVHIRVGGLDGRLYLDLCDAEWQAVEIDSTGWRVIENPPVRFRRAAGMLDLPMPVKGGSIDELRPFLNVGSDADLVLAVSWLVAALRNHGPYPPVALAGEQGSAKSTFSAVLRSLIDPNTSALRTLPREDRDLFIAATNGYVLAFDNVSGLQPWISDSLCRLATGGGFAVRQLYSDQEEVLFAAERPIILNGIEDIVTRADLADRAIILTLEPIPEDKRRPEAELWSAFEIARPRILGALLDAVVEAIKRLPETHLEKLPRMADFALWATAAESALWPAGTFGAAYCGNRDDAVESVIEADPVAEAVRTLMTSRTVWTGGFTDLLEALGGVIGEGASKSRKSWPDNTRALSGRLRRAATFLRKVGIEIIFGRRGHGRTRTVTISSVSSEKEGQTSSATSASATDAPRSRPANDFADGEPRTVDPSADGSDLNRTVRGHPPTCHACDAADDADAKQPKDSDLEGESVWQTRL